MNEDKCQTDGQTCQVACSAFFIGGSENDQYEDEGEYGLGYECLKHLSVSE